MEPNYNNYGPPTELPQPQEVNAPVVPEVAGNPARAETRNKQMPSTTSGTQQQTPLKPNLQSPQPQVSDIPSGISAGSDSTGTMIADDTDLIEKEWVTRAKAIVLQTKDDPHSQNREMNKVKADYLKKRYNKDLKINES